MASPPILSDPSFGKDGWIDRETLTTVLANQEPVLIVDVRNPDEFAGARSHIEGARNIPLMMIESSIGELMKEDRRIVFVCQTDRYARIAAAILRQAGKLDILVLRDGLEGWRKAGTD